VRRVGANAEVKDPIQHADEGVAVPSGTLSGALVGMGRGGKLDHGGKGFMVEVKLCRQNTRRHRTKAVSGAHSARETPGFF
jgi:hypothetical protein